jgi:Glycosyl transferases group 1
VRSQPSILVSWYTDPTAIPPFVLSKGQLTVGPKLRPDQPRLMYAGRTPIGVYDLKAALESQGLPVRYDLVVVYADASGMNFPLNLEAFDCPKALVVGDTHHLKFPLRQMLEYAKDARVDFIVSICTRHHLRWFREAGFAEVAWFPSLAIRHMPRPLRSSRKPQIGFVGQSTSFHPRRSRLIALLQSAGLPLFAGTAPREMAADIYAESIISFNASLNGDLNFRVFEVLSAGGCLVTDRLADESGLGLLLDEDKHYVGYDSADELIDKARYLLRHPDRALTVARAGNEAFVQSMLPEKRAADLLGWIFDGRLDELYRVRAGDPGARGDPIALADRVRVYEDLQQLHLETERPRILFDPGVPDIYRTDAADLRRLELVVAPRDPPPAGHWDRIVAAGPNGIECVAN